MNRIFIYVHVYQNMQKSWDTTWFLTLRKSYPLQDIKIVTPACHIPETLPSHLDNGGKCSFEFPKFSLEGDIVPIDNNVVGS